MKKEDYKKRVEKIRWLKMTLTMTPKDRLRLVKQFEAELTKPCPTCGKLYIEK